MSCCFPSQHAAFRHGDKDSTLSAKQAATFLRARTNLQQLGGVAHDVSAADRDRIGHRPDGESAPDRTSPPDGWVKPLDGPAPNWRRLGMYVAPCNVDVQNLTPDNGPGVTLRQLHEWSRGNGEFLYSNTPVINADGKKEPRSERHFTIHR